MTPTEFLSELGEALKERGCVTSYEMGQQTLVGSVNFYSLAVTLVAGTRHEIRCSHELLKDVLTFVDGATKGLKVELHETSRGLGALRPVAIDSVVEHFRNHIGCTGTPG